MKNLLTFEVGSLLAQSLGANERYSVDGPIQFQDFKCSSNLKAEVQLMRIDGGINAHVDNIEIEVERQCVKSLETYNEKIHVESAERQFYETEHDEGDPNDIYVIDMKNRKIDLTEMLRQEIILHFSVVPVSSSGSEIEWADKDAPEDGDLGNKPFAKLKDLLK